MINPVYEKYADVLVDYSVEVKKGDKVLIQGTMAAEPLLKAIYTKVLKNGGNPLVIPSFEEQEELYFEYASEEQLNYQSPFLKHIIENIDASISILANYNTKSKTNIDPKKMQKRSLANKEIMEIHMKRASEGDLNWTLCQFPTSADAQEAKMSLKDYEEFVFQACHLFEDDPVAYWEELGKELTRIADYLNDVKEIHYKSDDTDIKFNVEGRLWVPDKGKENYPGGEVFTGPVEDSAEGHIRFSYPGIFQGKEIEDIRLTFKKGKVVDASAEKGEELLKTLLDTDQGSKYLGEVAIGCNNGIDQFSRNMLFDEKIGGTVHLAIGRSYPETKGKNESTIHWDMLCDMSDGGEIFADGKLIYEDGEFLI
ncbi:MAG: aminopeptidase [Halanaerobiales bacterium]|nr:aminopeptidase [Halanaerobiales bacterium]